MWVPITHFLCACLCVFGMLECVTVSKWHPLLGPHFNPGQLVRPCGPSPAVCWVWSSGESTSEHKGLCSAPCLWVQAEQDHHTGLCSNHDNKRPQNKREALAYCQGHGNSYCRPGSLCVCVCVRERRKIELTVWGKKVPIALDGIRTCTSGIRAHRAADYTTKVGPASRQSKRTL